jgi:PTS system nitrogen regulatory IIA component
MIFEDLVQPGSVLCNAHARSKKHSLEILSELLVRSVADISGEDIFESLIERERLGCTSLNRGVAFPHCRVDGLQRGVAAVLKLAEPVDFDAPDDEPVDVIFGLAVPMELDTDHHAQVCEIPRLLADEELRSRLRAAATSSELYEVLCA